MSPVEITVVIIAAVIGVIALVMLIIVLAKLKALSRNNPNKPPKPAKPDFREMPVMPPQPQPVNNTPVPATAPSQPENIVPAPAAAPQADGFSAMLAANAKDFEGLYESLYVSCSDVGSFDADAYHEWCSRAAMSKDRSFAEAFARSFTDSEDTEHCKNSSVRLLGCISAAGIIRSRANGTVLMQLPSHIS